MMTSINTLAAAEHVADLRRTANRYRAIPSDPPSSGASQAVSATVALRLAHPDEAHLVRRLAAVDDAPRLEGQVLLALIDGEPIAALALWDERVVANPFVLTDEAVSLLRLRARQLSDVSPRRRVRATLLELPGRANRARRAAAARVVARIP
jgi:hypothetical protein